MSSELLPKKANRIDSWSNGLKSRHSIKSQNIVGWDEDRCRPIYHASKKAQVIKSICGLTTDQSITVNHSHADCFDDDGHNSTPVRLPDEKENIVGMGMDMEMKDTVTNPRKLNKRVTRSYGRMNICRKKGPSVAASSLLEHWRSPSKITRRKYKKANNRSKELKELSKKSKNALTSYVEADKVESHVSSLPSPSMKELVSYPTHSGATDEFDFMTTPQPIVKSICVMDSHEIMKSALSKKLNKKPRILFSPRTLILDHEDGMDSSSQSKTSTVKYCDKGSPRIYQPSSHTSLSDAKAFFAQLDATEELTINTTKDKNYNLYKRSRNSQCVRTVQKRNLSDPSLLKCYASYRCASKENGLSPLALQMFAICRSDHFNKSRMCDSLLEEN